MAGTHTAEACDWAVLSGIYTKPLVRLMGYQLAVWLDLVKELLTAAYCANLLVAYLVFYSVEMRGKTKRCNMVVEALIKAVQMDSDS